MTDDEKKVQMLQRNAAICAHYETGKTLAATSKHFRLSRQRVLQILKESGVWRPYVKSNRTQFLGVNVSEDEKQALQEEAMRRGMSMSSLTADLIKDMLEKD